MDVTLTFVNGWTKNLARFQMANGKTDTIIKVIVGVIFTVFLSVFTLMFNDVKTDVREIRKSNENYNSDLTNVKIELETLKLRVSLLDVIPPSASPILSIEDAGKIVELLKERKR